MKKNHASKTGKNAAEKSIELLVAQISSSFIDTEALDSKIGNALKLIGLFCEADRAYVFQVREHTTLTNTHEWCADGVEPQIENLKNIRADQELPWFWGHMKQKKDFYVPSVAALAAEAALEKQHFEMQDIKSLVVVPMVAGNNLLGFIGFDWVRVERSWPESIVSLLRMTAETIGRSLERRRTDEALSRNRELLNRTQEIAHLGSWELNLIDNALFWSDEVYRIFGLQPQEFGATYEAFLAAVHPDDRAAVDAAYTSSLREGRDMYEVEHRVVRKHTGEVRVVYEKCVHTRGADGRVIRSIGMVQDITDRKRVEDALRETEERFSRFMQFLPGPAFIKDDKLRHVFINDWFETVFEAKLADLQGKSPEDVWPPDIARQLRKNDESVLREGMPRQFEEEIEQKDGRRKYLTIKFPISRPGKAPLLGGIGVDITERKLAEEALRNIQALNQTFLETSPSGMVIFKASGPGVLANEAAARITGGSREQLAAADYRLIPSWKVSGLYDAALRAIESVGVVRIETDVFTTSFGKKISIDAVFSTFELGGEKHLALLFNDITERKLKEEFQVFLAQSGGDVLRGDFFHSLASFLAEKLNVDMVCIDSLDQENHAATTLALYFDGKFEDNLTYTLKDTPCGEVVEKSVCCFPRGVCDLFPQDQVLKDMKAEGYAGTILWDHQGKPIGLIALIWRVPLSNPDMKKSLLQLVSVRAAAELERKQAEEALRESEAKRGEAQKLAKVGYWENNLQRGQLWWDEQTCSIFGLSGHENISMERFLEKVHPEDRQRLHDEIESGQPFRTDYRIELPGGEIKYIHEEVNFEQDEDGQVIKICGTAQDITELITVENQLRESRQMLRAVLDTIPVRVFWKDMNSVFLGCNRTFALDAGLSKPDELLGKDDYAMGWRDQADLYRADDRLVMESDRPKLNFEESQTTPDGRRITLRTSKIPLKDSSGRIYGVLGTYEDITDRKQAENQLNILSTAIEQSPTSIVITDAAGNIEYVNPKFMQLTGYSFEEARGQNPRILKSGVQPPEVYDELWQTITAGNIWRGEFCNKKKNGELYWESVVISPVKDAAGIITHFLAVKEDISELKKAEKVKKGLEAQLRQAQKMETIGTLAGGIAHDFNNILQPVNSCTEMLRSKLPADSPMFKYVNLMGRSVDRGRDLVKQLLTFSRQKEQEKKSLRLQPIIEETLNMIRSLVPTTIHIRTKIDPDCRPVMADPVQVQQVIMNLCTNACDAMNNNGILTVQLESVDLCEETARGNLRLQSGCYARIVVRDTGHGMDEATQKRIFDPFFTTKDIGKGTGLGLSVVHGIVIEYGGDIVVDSTPGDGTSFNVYLPCTETIAEESLEDTQEAMAGEGGTILLLDDEEDITCIAQDMLEDLGYTVKTMNVAAEALDEFYKNSEVYDLVISDYAMPSMTGDKFAAEVAKIRPGIPIILITGNNEAIPLEKLREVSIREIVSKPFRIQEIAEAIRRALK